jgi:uncharacterized protein (DUF2267 family)
MEETKDQWKAEGNCEICRRHVYCTKNCKARRDKYLNAIKVAMHTEADEKVTEENVKKAVQDTLDHSVSKESIMKLITKESLSSIPNSYNAIDALLYMKNKKSEADKA